MDDIQAHIQKFIQLEERLQSEFSSFKKYGDYAFSIYEDPSKKQIDLWISGLVHGNEVVGIQVINQLLTEILEKNISIPFSFGISLGNVPAAKIQKRFVERDLNRSFSSIGLGTAEFERAQVLKKLAAKAKVTIDLHQTTGPTQSAFCVFVDRAQNYSFLQTMNVQLPWVVFPKEGFSHEGLTLIEHAVIAADEKCNAERVAITIELGQMGFSDSQMQLGLSFVKKALDVVGPNNFLSQSDFSHQEIYKIVGSIKNAPEAELLPGLKSFVSLKAGQVLATGPGGDILCPMDSKLLFPRYDENRKSAATLGDLLLPYRPSSSL